MSADMENTSVTEDCYMKGLIFDSVSTPDKVTEKKKIGPFLHTHTGVSWVPVVNSCSDCIWGITFDWRLSSVIKINVVLSTYWL